MALSDQEREEVAAVRDATTLHMLPPEANIASQRYLAEVALGLDDELRALDAEFGALDTSIPLLAEAVMVYRRIKQGMVKT